MDNLIIYQFIQGHSSPRLLLCPSVYGTVTLISSSSGVNALGRASISPIALSAEALSEETVALSVTKGKRPLYATLQNIKR